MKKKETCRRAELLVLMILESRIHERRQEDDKKTRKNIDVNTSKFGCEFRAKNILYDYRLALKLNEC